MKVQNFTNKNGKAIPNQFIITNKDGRYFQSYKSMIAFVPFDNGAPKELDSHYWDYSTTTGKYRNQFLGESKAETQKKIDSGEYVLTNLN